MTLALAIMVALLVLPCLLFLHACTSRTVVGTTAQPHQTSAMDSSAQETSGTRQLMDREKWSLSRDAYNQALKAQERKDNEAAEYYFEVAIELVSGLTADSLKIPAQRLADFKREVLQSYDNHLVQAGKFPSIANSDSALHRDTTSMNQAYNDKLFAVRDTSRVRDSTALGATVNVNGDNSDRKLGLWEAVEADDTLRVRELLKWGASPDVTHDSGCTPLMIAAGKGNLTMVEILVRAGADVNALGSCGPIWDGRPLHFSRGSPDIMEFLLASGADINAKDYDGYTVLDRAASLLDTASIALLCKHGANVHTGNRPEKPALLWILGRGGCSREPTLELSAAHMLLDYGADPNAKLPTAGAPRGTGVYFQQSLLQQYAGDDTVMVKLLLEHGANPNSKITCWETPLQLAVDYENDRMLRILLEYGAEVSLSDWEGNTALHKAVSRHNMNAISLLAEYATNLELRNGKGETPLWTAVEWDGLALVDTLLSLGCSVQTRNLQGATLLHAAAESAGRGWSNHGLDRRSRAIREPAARSTVEAPSDSESAISVIQRLISYGLDVNSRDKDGNTPLHAAAKAANENAARELLVAGAKVNSRNNSGLTPLGVAARSEHWEFCKLLAEHGGIK
jgi:ankyrin repeat protein